MSHTSPPPAPYGAIRYVAQHLAGRLPSGFLKVTEATIRAALPNGVHASPHTAEIIEGIGYAVANLDRLDAGRNEAGDLTAAGAADYQLYGERILSALRHLNLYPSAA